ncbi:MerC domain-containing protein [Limibacter armeniacum]|uniref:MerC domain-containing protein n=1 Tax=Limibacter armeniacum TaxID=466084 RepID=UPI002FE628C8
MINKLNRYADYIGITGSSLCLVHCILTSGATLISALMAHTHGNEHHHELNFWGWMDLSMIVVSIVAVYFAAKATHHVFIKTMLWGFLTLFVASTMGKFIMPHPAAWIEIIGWGGSLGLITTHFTNLYICRRHDGCEVRLAPVKN